jgi:protein TonB
MTPFNDNQNYFPVFKMAPEYPKGALQQEKEGKVILEFTVSASGFVVEPKVAHSTDPVFNDAALEAAKKFRYAPKFVDGKPVAVANVMNKIIFQMQPE